MEYTQDTYGLSALLFILAILFIPFFVAVYYLNVIKPFIGNRAYIKMEMNRSNREEYRYWKRKLKKLYIYHIPFFWEIYLQTHEIVLIIVGCLNNKITE